MSETKAVLVEGFRRETIEKAARRVMARRGVAGASMQAIADEAGVAKGTLYLYFEDRDDLLDQAVSAAFAELLERLREVLARRTTLRDSLRKLVHTKIEFFDANQEFLRVYMAMRYPDGTEESRHRRRRAPHYRRYLEMLTEYLTAATRRGEMKAMDASRLALFVAEGVSAILLRRLSEKPRPAGEDVEWIVDMLLNGISPRRRS